ncbi:MAG: hypothetical protein F9K24_20335 [Leptonema illini]|uniref:Uncharacterized protein n=1 Tax=Leptonema illini TaxID=183 RepID=A0A833LX89_9LEPT|nr:MAG: hypothetical protein F9K24_20335 [Leptonema illini]
MACAKCNKAGSSCERCSNGASCSKAKPADDDLKSIRERRLQLCLECSALRRWLKVPGTEQCGICACFVRAKTALKSETCPAGLW